MHMLYYEHHKPISIHFFARTNHIFKNQNLQFKGTKSYKYVTFETKKKVKLKHIQKIEDI